MKKFLGDNYKSFVGSTLIVLAIFIIISQTTISLAHPTRQLGSRPNFTLRGQNLPSGGATIQSQEVRLDHDYFANNGQLAGLRVASAGLSLAEGESSGVYESGVIDSPLTFTTDIVPLWEADLPDGAALRLETRLSFDGGDSWEKWLENPVAFYPVRDNLYSGNLIWAGNDQVALQFRVTLYNDQTGISPALNHLILAFSDTSSGPTDAEIADKREDAGIATESCPINKPAVVSRTDWGNPEGQNSPRRPPTYHPVTHIIIHQTETPNDTAPYQDYAGWVRSIWNFHAKVLGWGDVGYNFLIDPNGVIYEGRAGGDDVIGIHDGFNRGSMGIGFLGCYGNCDDPRLSVAEPSESMLVNAEHLMAWKLGQNEIDPLSSGPYASLNNTPVIAGGRDVAMTSSPGDNLYNKLPDLRVSVSERVNCQPATPTPTPELPVCQIQEIMFDRDQYEIGDTIHLTISLADHNGSPLSGAKVAVDVEKMPVSSQAASGFDLIDQVGKYEGSYNETDIAGEYLFKINATDSTGERFAACSDEATVLVNAPPTPTPTHTPTLTATLETSTTTPETPTTTPGETPTPIPETPTATPETPTPTSETPTPTPDTPTPTPTPVPTGATVGIEPAQIILSPCNPEESVAVNLKNASEVTGVELDVTYDPAVVQVIDADVDQDGVQVELGNVFAAGFVAENEVDTLNGRISFAAALLAGDTIEGDAQLITIDWQSQDAGITSVVLENVKLGDPDGQPIEATLQNGILEVSDNCQSVSGVVTLQSRNNHSGITVAGDSGVQVQTELDGAFSIVASDNSLTFNFPGYLSAQADILVLLESEQANNTTGIQVAYLGTITLLAGDVTGDDIIDIFDLAYMASHYQEADPLADLNADGIVDILDLALAANNYQQYGPLIEWQ